MDVSLIIAVVVSYIIYSLSLYAQDCKGSLGSLVSGYSIRPKLSKVIPILLIRPFIEILKQICNLRFDVIISIFIVFVINASIIYFSNQFLLSYYDNKIITILCAIVFHILLNVSFILHYVFLIIGILLAPFLWIINYILVKVIKRVMGIGFTNIKFIKISIVLSLVVAIFFVDIIKENNSKVGLTLSPEQIDLAKDYTSYWGIFIWTNDYCKSKGVNLNFDPIKQKYSAKITKLINKAQNTKINSDMVVEDIVNNPMFLEGAISNQIQGMNFFRNILIAEKVTKKDINKAAKIYQNLSNPEIVNQYGYLVSERDVCIEINSMIEKSSFEKNPILSNMLVFLNKY